MLKAWCRRPWGWPPSGGNSTTVNVDSDGPLSAGLVVAAHGCGRRPADAPSGTITASTGTDWADPVQDAAGNMTSVPKPSSLSAAYTLTYDAWNRLVKVQDNASADIATFAYDGLGRRIQKVDVAANPDIPT